MEAAKEDDPMSVEKLQSFAQVPSALTVSPTKAAGGNGNNKKKRLKKSTSETPSPTDENLPSDEYSNPAIFIEDEESLDIDGSFYPDESVQERVNQLEMEESLRKLKEREKVHETIAVLSNTQRNKAVPPESDNQSTSQDYGTIPTVQVPLKTINIPETIEVNNLQEPMDTNEAKKALKRKFPDNENDILSKVSKVMDNLTKDYYEVDLDELTNDKIQYYARIRNLMRLAQRVRGYVDIHLRKETPMAQKTPKTVLNSYIDEYYPINSTDNAIMQQQMEAKNLAIDHLWKTMLASTNSEETKTLAGTRLGVLYA